MGRPRPATRLRLDVRLDARALELLRLELERVSARHAVPLSEIRVERLDQEPQPVGRDL